ncbi:MAG TPA: 5'-3' exonuclease H3TH domain-containing protein [bacterium]|nr:5'-3' exonuclease H3TH domain-containing protein [bacterium]
MTRPKSRGPKPSIYLVDGDGLLYRAANAIPYFTNPAGVPTNGLHGFATMMFTLVRTAALSHLAVAFTADPPLRKHAWDPDYKINHYEHPDEIKAQMPYAMRFIEGLGGRALLVDGYEADDVIATLTARRRGRPVRIVSSDRDFYQLVSDAVRLVMPVRGLSEVREVGPPEVEAAWGVPPALVADLKALVGDTSDDIPGVRGVGPKTAAALLKLFPSVELLLEHLDGVSIPSVRGKLEPMRDRILLNKRLVLPLTVDLPAALDIRLRPPDREALTTLAEEIGVGVMRPAE